MPSAGSQASASKLSVSSAGGTTSCTGIHALSYCLIEILAINRCEGARLHLRVPQVSALRPAPKTQAHSPSSLGVSALGASYKSISEYEENTVRECAWARAGSGRLVLHTI